MNTSDPLSSVLVATLVVFGAGIYYYDAQFSDAGMLGRARSALYEFGSQSHCDARGNDAQSGESDCWTGGGYRLVKDKDGLFRIFTAADGKADAIGGVREGAAGAPELFVDRPRLEKAVEALEAARPWDANVRYVTSS
ncbi:hypothetical protein D3C71_249980 [compost metagenome]